MSYLQVDRNRRRIFSIISLRVYDVFLKWGYRFITVPPFTNSIISSLLVLVSEWSLRWPPPRLQVYLSAKAPTQIAKMLKTGSFQNKDNYDTVYHSWNLPFILSQVLITPTPYKVTCILYYTTLSFRTCISKNKFVWIVLQEMEWYFHFVYSIYLVSLLFVDNRGNILSVLPLKIFLVKWPNLIWMGEW